MIHAKPSVIICIRRDDLIIAGKKVKPARLTFPAGIVADLEILDELSFEQGCAEFFAAHEIKGKRVLIVLDDSIVFTKNIDANPQKAANARRSFIDAMPFATGKRSCIADSAETTKLYATNARLYETIRRAIAAADGGKVLAVTPVAAYGVSMEKNIADALRTFTADTTVPKRCDFSTVKPL